MTEQRGRIKIGIVSNEFFDPELGGLGGFGWAAMSAAKFFQRNPALGFEPVFLTGRIHRTLTESNSHGARIIFAQGNWTEYVRRLQREQIDLLLLIDYRAE